MYLFKEITEMLLVVFLVVCLVLGVTIGFVSLAETHVLDSERMTLQQTVDSLTDNTGFDSIGVNEAVIEFNIKLASYKKWNQTPIIKWLVSDKVDNLEPVKVERNVK